MAVDISEPQPGTHVSRATSIVAEQAGCSINEAHALMQNTARATDETIEFIANEVLYNNLRFD